MAAIRNFIYLDNDKLNSLYSQIFEGMTDTIVQSCSGLNEKANQGKNIEVPSVSTNKILYDHMYNRLEDKLADKIIVCGEYENVVYPNSIVKVTGKAKIEDYARLKFYMDKFTDIELALKYIQKEKSATNVTNLDSKFLSQLSQLITLFEMDGYEILIDNNQSCYRGIINEKKLRVSKNALRLLYGANPDMDWTMVGQITQITPKYTDFGEGEENIAVNVKSPKATLKELFSSLDEVETSFFGGDGESVYNVFPIAIYIEYFI